MEEYVLNKANKFFESLPKYGTNNWSDIDEKRLQTLLGVEKTSLFSQEYKKEKFNFEYLKCLQFNTSEKLASIIKSLDDLLNHNYKIFEHHPIIGDKLEQMLEY